MAAATGVAVAVAAASRPGEESGDEPVDDSPGATDECSTTGGTSVDSVAGASDGLDISDGGDDMVDCARCTVAGAMDGDKGDVDVGNDVAGSGDVGARCSGAVDWPAMGPLAWLWGRTSDAKRENAPMAEGRGTEPARVR